MQAKNTGKILIIDPDPGLAEETKRLVSAWGYEVQICTGHLQGLTWLEDIRFGLALVVVENTDIDGFEFCKLVRTREAKLRQGRTWLVLLGSDEDWMAITSDHSGADDFLLRPFLPAELKWRIESGLNKQRLINQILVPEQADLERPVLDRSGFFSNLKHEISRSSRRTGKLSVLILWLRGLELAELNFGPGWIAWLESRLLQALLNKLRIYDKLGSLGRGRWCALVAEASWSDLQALAARLQNQSQQVIQEELQDKDWLRLCYSGLTLQLDLQNFSLDLGADLLWAWILEQPELQDKHCALHKARLTSDQIMLEE